MRQLATIQRVIEVQPIPNADAIEVATVRGWHCVVKKDEVKPGDLAVYIEIDSICPAREPFLFLEPRRYKVKTIVLRKQISQGLCMPLSLFHEFDNKDVAEGMDVTELLGITKHDPEDEFEQMMMKSLKRNPVRDFFMQFYWFRKLHRLLFPGAAGAWPEFIHKTDEERIQNATRLLTQYANRDWYCTEKLDGRSASYFVTRTEGRFGKTVVTFGVCSRKIFLKTRQKGCYWKVAEQYGIKEKLMSVGKNICIQGEIVGPGVRKNKYGLTQYEFYVFNIFNIDTQQQYSFDEMVAFCKMLNLPIVPILSDKEAPPQTVDEVVKQATAKSVINQTVQREGVVWRTHHNEMNGLPISFKAINPQFLLKYDDETE